MGDSAFGREAEITRKLKERIGQGASIVRAAKAEGVLESVARRLLAAARTEEAKERKARERRGRKKPCGGGGGWGEDLPWMSDNYIHPDVVPRPTVAQAGSAKKVAVMVKRLERGEQLFHDDDPYCTSAGSGLMAGLFCRDARSLGSLAGGMFVRDD